MAQLSTTGLLSHPNLAAYWKLDNDWSDQINSNTLTAANSPTFITGKYGTNAAHFVAASSQQATRATTSLTGINITGSQTWMCWVRLTSNISYESPMALRNAGGTANRYFLCSNDSGGVVYFNLTGLTTTPQITSNRTVTADGSWHHLVGVYDSANSLIKIYIDGVLDNQATASGSCTAISDGNFGIGASNGSNYFNGDVDDAAIFSAALTGAEIAEIYNDQAAGYLNTNALRLNSGSSQYVSITGGADFQPSTNMTFEAWIKPLSLPTAGNYPVIMQSFCNATTQGFEVFLDGDNSGNLRCYIQASDGTSVNANSNVSPTIGIWNHVAVTYDGSNIRLYLNGTLANTVACTKTMSWSGTNYVLIGAYTVNGTASRFLNSYIDDVRFFNGTVKTLAQIQSDMRAPTLALTTNLKARYLFDSSSGTSATDSSGNSHTGTLTGFTAGKEGWTTDVPYTGIETTKNNMVLALSRVATQYLTAADNNTLDLSGNFTIEAYINFRSLGNTSSIVCKGNYNTNTRAYTLIWRNTNRLEITISNNGSNTTVVYYGWTPTVNTWYHIAVVCTIANAAATQFEFFINGVSVGNGTVSTNGSVTSINNSAGNLFIGAENGVGTAENTGDFLLDELRIWNATRTATQILANMQADVTNQSNLVSYWKAENNGIDPISYNNLTPINSPVFLAPAAFTSYISSILLSSLFFGQL